MSMPKKQQNNSDNLPTVVKSKRYRWLKIFMYLTGGGFIAGVLLVAGILFYFAQQVPDFRSLADYNPSLVTKVYARDGTLLTEYARQRRLYVAYKDIPQPVVNAFLAAEDTKFFEHPGFDLKAIFRAALVNLLTDRFQGASTITQQVAKTFLLTRDRTITRKIKELILAWRIERYFTKEEILELYLNQIYMGSGAYGVAAAAQTYYNKTLDELTLGQRAMLAGLPKAPSAYSPSRNPRLARQRRDVILRRIEAVGFASTNEVEKAINTDLELDTRSLADDPEAAHFSEHVRRLLAEQYGRDTLYEGGLNVFTTLDHRMQKIAAKAIYKGLRDYDRRHGYRGPLGRISLLFNWQSRIDEEYLARREYRDIGVPAAVLEVDDGAKMVTIGLPGGGKGKIPFAAMRWAREYIDVDTQGYRPAKPSDVVALGDIILAKQLFATLDFADKSSRLYKQFKDNPNLYNLYSLEQRPAAQAALVALDAKTGAVRAMVGGLGDGIGFNRAVQARRQAGSAFKPFVYALALSRDYTPASTILDAPVVMRTNEMDDAWKPQNYSEKIYGPSTLRRGLEKSRNLMTIRLARDLGIGSIIRFARKFGLSGELAYDLSTSLGSGSFTLLELTSAYSVFPNSGKRAEPYFVERIQDNIGQTLSTQLPGCYECLAGWSNYNEEPPQPEIPAEEVIDPQVAYQVVSLMEGVVKRGTGWRARAVGKPVGAKTGTTNDYIDAWYMGFSPALAVGVWVGFDRPQTLGKPESGSKAAGPIWVDFMKDALKHTYAFNIPEGLSFVRVDAETGKLPGPRTKKTLLEVFREGTQPAREKQKLPEMDKNLENFDLFGIY